MKRARDARWTGPVLSVWVPHAAADCVLDLLDQDMSSDVRYDSAVRTEALAVSMRLRGRVPRRGLVVLVGRTDGCPVARACVYEPRYCMRCI